MIAILAIMVLGCACSQPDIDPAPPQYSSAGPSSGIRCVLAIHPLHNPQKLLSMYGPLVDYLNAALAGQGVYIVLEGSRSYAAFEEKLAGRKFDFAVLNPSQTIQSARHGYRVFARMLDLEPFCGLVLVAAESTVRTPADLKGQTVAYPAPTAMAAAMMPQLYFVENGLGTLDEVRTLYVGSQESSIMSVLSGQSQAGCTWPLPWRIFMREHPDEAARLRVAWRTSALPGLSVAGRDDVPEQVSRAVTQTLLGMSEDTQGRDVLQRLSIAGFEAANDETYQPVRDFLERFDAKVRRQD